MDKYNQGYPAPVYYPGPSSYGEMNQSYDNTSIPAAVAYPPIIHPAIDSNSANTQVRFNAPIPFPPGTEDKPVIVRPRFGRRTTLAYCDYCNINVSTKTTLYIGCLVWCCFIFFLILIPILAWIPFVSKNEFWNVRHNCPRCNRVLGGYRPGS